MKATWSLSAPPVPTTAFLTTVAAYSATGRPARAGATRAMARAWPSLSALAALLFMKVSSTAASSGLCSATRALIASNRTSRRSEKGRDSLGAMTPCATWARRAPSMVITPQPVRRRPGSSPRIRTAAMGDSIGVFGDCSSRPISPPQG